MARMLAAQVQAAHRQITSALTPPGEPGERDWEMAGPYARHHLAAHAAACGYLDALASDPGFLLAADPGAVLAQRVNLRTPDGKRALAAFDLGLHDWEAATPAARLDRLAANAARVQAVRAQCGMHDRRGRVAGSLGSMDRPGPPKAGWPQGVRLSRWLSGGPGTGTSSSPAPMMGRCGSGTRSPATRSACRWPTTTAR